MWNRRLFKCALHFGCFARFSALGAAGFDSVTNPPDQVRGGLGYPRTVSGFHLMTGTELNAVFSPDSLTGLSGLAASPALEFKLFQTEVRSEVDGGCFARILSGARQATRARSFGVAYFGLGCEYRSLFCFDRFNRSGIPA